MRLMKNTRWQKTHGNAEARHLYSHRLVVDIHQFFIQEQQSFKLFRRQFFSNILFFWIKRVPGQSIKQENVFRWIKHIRDTNEYEKNVSLVCTELPLRFILVCRQKIPVTTENTSLRQLYSIFTQVFNLKKRNEDPNILR